MLDQKCFWNDAFVQQVGKFDQATGCRRLGHFFKALPASIVEQFEAYIVHDVGCTKRLSNVNRIKRANHRLFER
jgi:hypothetical protein